MDRNELKKIIKEEAAKMLSLDNNQEDITPEQIRNLAEECKKINSSLDFRSPIISDEQIIAESKSKKTESSRWGRLVEYKVFEEEELEDGSKMPLRPEDYFDYVVSHNGLNENSLEEASMKGIRNNAMPYILAGYLALFGGKVAAAVSEFEKATDTTATTEVIQQGVQVAKEKGVQFNDIKNLADDPSKGKANSKIKYTPTSKPSEIVKYDENGYPIYLKGTPSHSAWKTAFDGAKGSFETWKSGLADQGIDFKTQNPTELDSHLKFKEIGGRLYLVYHYGEVNPDGTAIENTSTGNNLDYYLDLGPAPEKAAVSTSVPTDSVTVAKEIPAPIDSTATSSLPTQSETGIKGNKQKFSMNVGTTTHFTRDAAGNKVDHKVADIVNGEKISFPDGTQIMKGENGTYYDISDVNNIKKVDPSSEEYKKYDLDGKNQIKASDARVIKQHIKSLRNK